MTNQNGLKSMLATFQRLAESETAEMSTDAKVTILVGGVIAVLEEVRIQGENAKGLGKKITRLDRRLIVVGIMALLALAAVAAHTGWSWLNPVAAVPP